MTRAMTSIAALIARGSRPLFLARARGRSFAVVCRGGGPSARCVSSSASASDASVTPPETKKKKAKRAIPPPHFLRPPAAPADAETWQNMVLLVDKPPGWTSFDVVGKTRGISRALAGVKKVGHCGTLDPMATGLLILCVGKATKLVETFTGMDKRYTGTMRLGEGTPSQDACTDVDEVLPWEHVSDRLLTLEARKFVGDVVQIPPMYSAIKVKGERLYKAARRGETVERKPRNCVVTAFEVTRDAEDPRLVHFDVACSKGTYVRTLAHDLGRALGTVAHLTALRRESVGEHDVKDAWTVDALVEACAPALEAKKRQRDALEKKEKEAAEKSEGALRERGDAAPPGKALGEKDDGGDGGDERATRAWVSIPGFETTFRVVTPPPAGDRVDDPVGSVAVGDTVTVHATGSVAEESGANARPFWSTRDEGQTAFTYVAGVGAVIPGWDQALLGARAGEVREARIPAKEGYGARGFPAWGIPPGATLAFEIEVVKNEGQKAP